MRKVLLIVLSASVMAAITSAVLFVTAGIARELSKEREASKPVVVDKTVTCEVYLHTNNKETHVYKGVVK